MLKKFPEIFESGAVQRRAILVDLEKCCKMSIWTQKSASIQKRTSCPKFAEASKRYPTPVISLALIAVAHIALTRSVHGAVSSDADDCRTENNESLHGNVWNSNRLDHLYRKYRLHRECIGEANSEPSATFGVLHINSFTSYGALHISFRSTSCDKRVLRLLRSALQQPANSASTTVRLSVANLMHYC